MLDALTVDQQNTLILGACIFGAIVFIFVEIWDHVHDKREKNREAFYEGADAYWERVSAWNCPYPNGTEMRNQWMRGFLQSNHIDKMSPWVEVEFSDTKQ